MVALMHKSMNRPQLVLAHASADYAQAICRHYNGLGWETHQVSSAREARTLAGELAPTAVVLGTELPDESGWLTCDKIRLDRPAQKVILVTDRSSPGNRRFAEFVGASALVHEDAGIEALAEQVGGRLASAVLS